MSRSDVGSPSEGPSRDPSSIGRSPSLSAHDRPTLSLPVGPLRGWEDASAPSSTVGAAAAGGDRQGTVRDPAAAHLGPPVPHPEGSERGTRPGSADLIDEEIAQIARAARVRVSVIGCGGAGSNTVHRCVEEGIQGAELCALNTDVAHLLTIHAHRKILLGRHATRGRGAGSRPEVGLRAAEESEEEIRHSLKGVHLALITAGLGGGTGTGAAPVVARLAREAGALTLGIVTLPFSSEGELRREVALEGLRQLRTVCDTTLVIENDRLLDFVPFRSVSEAFHVADGVLTSAIQGISETITKPGLVNLDFADLRTVMREGGVALVGLGRSGPGPDRALDAVEAALASPLLGPVEIAHATGAFVHVVGDPTLSVAEAERVSALVGAKIAKNARILWGCSVEPSRPGVEPALRVLVILTGKHTVDRLAAPKTPEPAQAPIRSAAAPAPGTAPGVGPPAPTPPWSAFAYRLRTMLKPTSRNVLRKNVRGNGRREEGN